MIIWAVAGLIAGWLLSTRLGVGSLGVFLLSSIVLPLFAFALSHGIDVDAIWGFAAFWVAVQGSYLLANLFAEKTPPAGADPASGSKPGALERA